MARMTENHACRAIVIEVIATQPMTTLALD